MLWRYSAWLVQRVVALLLWMAVKEHDLAFRLMRWGAYCTMRREGKGHGYARDVSTVAQGLATVLRTLVKEAGEAHDVPPTTPYSGPRASA
jgi:hypothetical protein